MPQFRNLYQILQWYPGIGAELSPHQISPFQISHAPNFPLPGRTSSPAAESSATQSAAVYCFRVFCCTHISSYREDQHITVESSTESCEALLASDRDRNKPPATHSALYCCPCGRKMEPAHADSSTKCINTDLRDIGARSTLEVVQNSCLLMIWAEKGNVQGSSVQGISHRATLYLWNTSTQLSHTDQVDA